MVGGLDVSRQEINIRSVDQLIFTNSEPMHEVVRNSQGNRAESMGLLCTTVEDRGRFVTTSGTDDSAALRAFRQANLRGMIR